MPYPKEYLIYCSLANKNPSRSISVTLFQSWLTRKKKEYELEKPKEDFITWLESLKPGTHPLSQLQPKEEDNSELECLEK